MKIKEILLELRKKIDDSSLDSKQKKEFYDLLSKFSPAELEVVLIVLRENMLEIDKLYQNYIDKKKAFENNDKEAIDRILADEVAQLESIE